MVEGKHSNQKDENLKKRVNPETTANIFSTLSFQWIQDLLSLGNKRPLNNEDMYPLHPLLVSERLTALLEQQWLSELSTSSQPSLGRALVKRHLGAIVRTFFLANVEGGLRIFAPWLIARVTAYFVDDKKTTLQMAVMYGVLLSLAHFSVTSVTCWMFYSLMKLGSVLRISLSGLIYRKACRITQAEMGRTSVGHIINLITNDAQRTDDYILPCYVVMNLPLVVIVSFLMMYREIGLYGTLGGFAAMIALVPLQSLMGKILIKLRYLTAPLTDDRVKTINGIIASMKIIKMYGWEHMFRDFVKKIRKKESHYIGYDVLLKCLSIATYFISPIISTFCMVAVKRACDEEITKDMVYFYLSLSSVLRLYIDRLLGLSFAFIPQIIHCLRRIQDFLNAEEIRHIEKVAVIKGLSNDVIKKKKYLHKVDFNGVVVANKAAENGIKDSETDNHEAVIELVDVSADWGEDTFGLRNINLTVRQGELVAIVGQVGCGKTSLLMTLIQELMVRSGEFAVRADQVDFAAQTSWIFNGTVEENILFNREMDKERLDSVIRACYLAKDLEQLSYGLNTIVGERGVQLSGGQRARVSLARAVYGQNPLILLDDPLSAVDSSCAKHIFNKLIKQDLAGKTRILVTHSTNFLSECDRIIVMEKGQIAHDGSWAQLEHLNLNNMLVSERKRTTSHTSEIESDAESEADIPEKDEQVEEERQTGSLDKTLYLKYFALGLGPAIVPVLLVILIAPQFVAVYTEQYLLTHIAVPQNISTSYSIGEREMSGFTVYILLGAFTVLLFIFRMILFVFIGNHSAKLLHNRALYAVLRSPMRFFDTTPVGIVLNRFTKDTYYMDERFPACFIDFACLAILNATRVVMVAVANYWFIVALIPVMVVIVWCTRFYLKSSIEIRRVEAISRSPVLSHIGATLAGLTTIRASRQVDVYEGGHYAKRDDHTKCWMMFIAASRWLNFRLDILAILATMVATFACILLKNVVGSDIAGLAIVYINGLVMGFQWCVRQSTETENLMTAIERIFSFTKLPSEAPLECKGDEQYKDVGEKRGVIEFRKVSMRYASELPYVLQKLSFITKPAEKIGIVGRTGAGKSTILQALFRICEPEGEVLIDGVNCAELGLHTLRRSISVIPQESLLFSATLKINMDPFEEFGDEKLWNCLEQVQLKAYVSEQGDKLDMVIQEGGSNLSSGQRQLLCLARALLRNNKILVIDEATANVDQKTDELIQETLRNRFVDCTVLTIAHRINTIIDSDRIMVMDGGELVEFDSPKALLEKSDSIFSMLVQETGFSKSLRVAADEAYNKKH